MKTGVGLVSSLSDDDRTRIETLRWYHTIQVTPDLATKGWFDLRHALPHVPFPDVTGKRCLDIGTWDGFYAYEMERRGAAEVVALDVASLADLDYPPAALADPDFDPSDPPGQHRQAGFDLLHEIVGSRVTLVPGSIYDLDPAELGTFDVVVVGSLLVHLRDPVRALDAVRRVTSGELLAVDYLHTATDLVSRLTRHRPLFELRGQSSDFQWWLASDAGLRHLLRVGGFAVTEASPRFLLRFGPALDEPLTGRRQRLLDLANRVVAVDRDAQGHLHRAYRCRPRF